MSEQRVLFLQKSLIGTCSLASLVVLASFYAVVDGAVHRAARQRLAGVDAVTQSAAPAPAQRAAARGSALLARVGS